MTAIMTAEDNTGGGRRVNAVKVRSPDSSQAPEPSTAPRARFDADFMSSSGRPHARGGEHSNVHPGVRQADDTMRQGGKVAESGWREGFQAGTTNKAVQTTRRRGGICSWSTREAVAKINIHSFMQPPVDEQQTGTVLLPPLQYRYRLRWPPPAIAAALIHERSVEERSCRPHADATSAAVSPGPPVVRCRSVVRPSSLQDLHSNLRFFVHLIRNLHATEEPRVRARADLHVETIGGAGDQPGARMRTR
nr:hypothetical protein CFP56_32362 [Quercus suber]